MTTGPHDHQASPWPLGQLDKLIHEDATQQCGNVQVHAPCIACPVQTTLQFLLLDAVTSLPSPSEIVSLQKGPNFFLFFFSTSFTIATCRKFGLPFLGKAQQPQEQLPIPISGCSIFVHPNNGMAESASLGFLMCTQMLRHASVNGGCTDAVRESALKTAPGRKIPCHTGDPNPPKYCTSAFQLGGSIS